MTLKELEAVDREYLVPTEVAPILGCKPYTINVAAKKGTKFPFPVILMGSRVRIPKAPFLKAMRGE